MTPSVRKLSLTASNTALSFQPGQWVDFFIDGVDIVGGYSLTSTPTSLPELELAVKYSQHAPAHWVHTSASVGDVVEIRPGGSFFWDAEQHPPPLILVAGGIGITPLMSILRTAADHASKQQSEWSAPHTIQVLYSVRNAQEALFLHELQEIQKQFAGGCHLQVHVTGPRDQPAMSDAVEKQHGRIQAADLQAAVARAEARGPGDVARRLGSNRLDRDAHKAYPHIFVCGPPDMTDHLVATTEQFQLPSRNVHFERWW